MIEKEFSLIFEDRENSLCFMGIRNLLLFNKTHLIGIRNLLDHTTRIDFISSANAPSAKHEQASRTASRLPMHS